MGKMGYTGKVWATEGYTVASSGLHRQSMGYTGKAWATEGYTVLSMDFTGKVCLHSSKMGYTVIKLHRQTVYH